MYVLSKFRVSPQDILRSSHIDFVVTLDALGD